jgi:hypothetical protein
VPEISSSYFWSVSKPWRADFHFDVFKTYGGGYCFYLR